MVKNRAIAVPIFLRNRLMRAIQKAGITGNSTV